MDNMNKTLARYYRFMLMMLAAHARVLNAGRFDVLVCVWHTGKTFTL